MESQPFSAPSENNENITSTDESAPQVLPPATVSIGGPSPVNVLHSTLPHQIVVQEKGGNTVSNVFLIIGAVVFVIGLGLGGFGAVSFSNTLEKVDEIGAKKVSKIQPLLDDTIVFSSTGNTINESFEFNTKLWYNVRAAQGVTINSISILDENNNTLFFEDDCKDYTTVDIGNLNLERSYVGSAQFINGTININATGEVTINNLDDDFWEDTFVISEQIDGEYFGGPVLTGMFGLCLGCCIAPVGFLVGIIIRFA